MGLMDELDKADKKGLFKSNDNFVMYSTGYLPLDYANGFWQQFHTPTGIVNVPATGIMGGTFSSLISISGGGKSTLADQIAWNIVKPFENGMVFHLDCEKTSNINRILQITGKDPEDRRFRLIKDHTSIDECLEMVDKVCEVKESMGKEAMHKVDYGYGTTPFMYYQPTVFIIDSLPSFNSKEFNVKDLGGNADQMRAAKDVTRFYTNCLDRAWQYNLIFLVINHIRPKTDMNPYASPPKGLLLLGPQETLPRGHVAQYYSQTYFRIRRKKSDFVTEEDYGFNGSRSTIELAKSKTNASGTIFPIVFNNAIGFDPVFTMYEFANDLGLIKGRNPYLYIEGGETRRFARKDFRKIMLSDEEFRTMFMQICEPYLQMMLSEKPSSVSPSDVSLLDTQSEFVESA